MKKKASKPTFLCIDDDRKLDSLCEAIQIKSKVLLAPEPPPPTWEAAIENITDGLTGQKYDGLLLDFRLDEYPTGTKNPTVRYTAESLVNELRRKSVEGSDKSYPVVLWSTAENLAWYFSINPSYTGLYDGIWDKAVALRNASAHGNMLVSLAKGYKSLHVAAKKSQPLHVVLNCNATSVVTEMEQAFTAKIKQAPYAFNYATFILNRILHFNGVLIDHPTTAAILGISPDSSVEVVIDKLSDKKSPIRYSGVFSQSSERFWRADLLDQLNKLLDGGHWLHLCAKDRVAVLNKKLRLKSLKPAASIHPTYQTDFDCVCAHSKRPLACRNGYKLRATFLDPWIQPSYIAGTIYRSLPHSELKRIRLDIGEQERFESDFLRQSPKS